MGEASCPTQLASCRPLNLTPTSNGDAGTAGEVQVVGDRAGTANVLGDAEADNLRHTGPGAVPVDFEALGVTLVEVVGGDEVEADSIRIGTDAGDDDGRETGFRVGGEFLGGGNLEIVGGVGGGFHG